MCYPTPVSTRATYFQAAFDAGVVDNSRKGLLLTEGASEVQGFTGALCIHLLEYILYCHGVSSSFFAAVLAELQPKKQTRLVWVWREYGGRSFTKIKFKVYLLLNRRQSAHGTCHPEQITYPTFRSAEQSWREIMTERQGQSADCSDKSPFPKLSPFAAGMEAEASTTLRRLPSSPTTTSTTSGRRC